MLTFYPSRIPDPGSRGQNGTGSRIRIRNTVANADLSVSAGLPRKACGQDLLVIFVTMYREVDVDERMRMDPKKLEEMILEDKAKGHYEYFKETVS